MYSSWGVSFTSAAQLSNVLHRCNFSWSANLEDANDKDMSGLCIDWHVFLFAACQFGLKTAGSQLNSLVMSVARYLARLPTPVHVAAWVDELHFSMSTPPHQQIQGKEGGCPTCVEFYGHALRAQALCRSKAAGLGLTQSSL
jgi:hypothetical protein